MQFLRAHPLVSVVPLVVVPSVLLLVYFLASMEAQTPNTPFIYDLF